MEMKKYKLGEIASFIGSGMTPLRSNENYWNSKDYPWLKTEQLGEYQIFDTNEYISKVALEETNLKLFPKNTLSVAMYGEGKTRGNVSILAEQMTTNQACCNIIVDNKFANYKFIYYWLKNSYYKLRSLSSGIRNNLNSEDIKKFEINLPSLPTQQKIAAVLSSLDDKIALNKKINAKLEAMAKRLYDYWFVQFDFPNEEGKPYKTSGGKMVWNEVLKREIPEGWEVKRLGDLFLNKISATEPGEHLKNLEYCPIDEIPMRRMSFAGGKSYNEANSSLQLYGMKDILIGAMRVYFHRCCIAAKAGITRTTTIVLTPHNKTHLSYLYQVCNEDKTFDFAIKVSNGTQQPYVTWKALSDYYFVYPNDETIIDVFCDKTNSVIEMVLKNEKEIQKLTDLRDRLLPLLMNGQVEVE